MNVPVFYHEVNMVLYVVQVMRTYTSLTTLLFSLFSNAQRVITKHEMQSQLCQLNHHLSAQTGAEHGLLIFNKKSTELHWILDLSIHFIGIYISVQVVMKCFQAVFTASLLKKNPFLNVLFVKTFISWMTNNVQVSCSDKYALLSEKTIFLQT